METLAFIHTAVAYEDPNPESELRSFEDLSLKAPGSIALGVLSAGVVTATLSHADQAQALITYGNRGSGVAQLQRKLGITADGVFGPQTYDSVVRHQVSSGLRKVDGIAGPETLVSLGLPAYLSSGPSISRPGSIESGQTAYVTARIGLRVRSSPGGSVVGGLPYGARVSLTGNTQGGWSELTSGNWVASDYVGFSSLNRNPGVETGSFANVRTRLLVRSAPAGYVTGSIGSGESLRRTGAEQYAAGRSWSQIEGGGWVASDYIGYR